MPDDLLHSVPTFALVFFRLAGMMLAAPLFGGVTIPRQVKVVLALVLAYGLMQGVAPPAVMPRTTWELAAGIAGELAFGLAMGMALSLVFVAARWAGEILGQQMGFSLGEMFDPQSGGHGSPVGQVYFMLTVLVFLTVGGHRAMLQGVRASFDALPLLSVGLNQSLLDSLVGLLQGATGLALQLAAPVLVTMLVVDLVLGLLGKVMPQLNVMAAGMTLRAAVGMVVLIVGLSLTSGTMRDAVVESMEQVRAGWTAPPPAAAVGGS